MHTAWRLLWLSSSFAVACTAEQPRDPESPSGSGGSHGSVSPSDTGDSGETDTGDLGTDTGTDLPGCDLLGDPVEECGPNMACDPETSTCVPANGTGIVDEPCIDTSECTSGLVCSDGRCLELCDPDIGGMDECEADRVCTRATL